MKLNLKTKNTHNTTHPDQRVFQFMNETTHPNINPAAVPATVTLTAPAPSPVPAMPEAAPAPAITPVPIVTTDTTQSRTMMNGKEVLYRENARKVLAFESPFEEKLLCNGLTLNLGDSCAFSCSYCYVPLIARKFTFETLGEKAHVDVVVRRPNAIGLLKDQLLDPKGDPKHNDPADTRVVYSSTLVDVAANMELARETADACTLILENTNWQIRLLTKSNLLPKLVENIPTKHHQRLILGVSTGTLDENVARAIEKGTAMVSKRIQSLHWLQDRGFRTFGMICPSLPQADYNRFAQEEAEAIRIDRCEHVWAEVINVRGGSFTLTHAALVEAGLHDEAELLATVLPTEEEEGDTKELKMKRAAKQQAWEAYARNTFAAHTQTIPAGKLRFLQYVTPKTQAYWQTQHAAGAVLLGKAAQASTENLTGGAK